MITFKRGRFEEDLKNPDKKLLVLSKIFAIGNIYRL